MAREKPIEKIGGCTAGGKRLMPGPVLKLARKRFMASWLALLTLAIIHVQGHAQAPVQLSDAESYRISFSSQLEPIVINRMHNWVVHIETAEGEWVEDAEIAVSGGMPAHRHGLPTSPQMTKYLGDGNYLIEGMRFHMNGSWQVTIAISTHGKSDTVTFEFEL
jgi:hypothetical protein